MFDSESEMTQPVKRWMESLGLIVKLEFVSPWGICDLVGLRFKKKSVARRLESGLRRPVTSMARAALLLQIPDSGTALSVSLRELVDSFSPALSREEVMTEIHGLLADKFVVCEGDRLRKISGWIPLQERLMAVELKLHRVQEALLQAHNNLGFATESLVALPAGLAGRVAKSGRRKEFEERGVGLLAVSAACCELLIDSHRKPVANPIFQFCCVEKFWRAAPKGSLA